MKLVPTVSLVDELVPYTAIGILRFDDLQVEVDAEPLPPSTPPDTAEIRGRTAMVRSWYRRFGMDPTKTRPSSEALLRRVRRGQPWPAINSLVDICNRYSLASQLPFGLYDLDQIVGDVVLRLGLPDEEYEGIRKATVHLTGRPALFGALGPFGNPTSDSARTMVTTRTTRALIAVFAPREVGAGALDDVLARTAEHTRATTGGTERIRQVVSGAGSAAKELWPDVL